MISNEDSTTKICTRCGQPVNRAKDSWKQIGGDVAHTSCPTSTALKAIAPALKAIVPAEPPVRGRPQFLTMPDAAKMLSVSVDTIRRRVRAGDLPAHRLKGTRAGGRQTILIDQADVLALLEPYTGTEDTSTTPG